MHPAPGLGRYPYVKGASGHGDLSDVTAPHLTAERGKGGYAGGKGGHSPVTDFWGRPYEAEFLRSRGGGGALSYARTMVAMNFNREP